MDNPVKAKASANPPFSPIARLQVDCFPKPKNLWGQGMGKEMRKGSVFAGTAAHTAYFIFFLLYLFYQWKARLHPPYFSHLSQFSLLATSLTKVVQPTDFYPIARFGII